MKNTILLLSLLLFVIVSCTAVESGEDGSKATFDNSSSETRSTTPPLVSQDAVEAVPILGAPFGFEIDIPVSVGESFLSGSSLAVSLAYNSSGEVAAKVHVNNQEVSELDLELCLTKVNRRTCQSVRNDVISSQASKEVQTAFINLGEVMGCARAALKSDGVLVKVLSVCQNGVEPIITTFRYYYGLRLNVELYKASDSVKGLFDFDIPVAMVINGFGSELILYSLTDGAVSDSSTYTLPTKKDTEVVFDLGSLALGADEYCYALTLPLTYPQGEIDFVLDECIAL